jgi:hypothetical protein
MAMQEAPAAAGAVPSPVCPPCAAGALRGGGLRCAARGAAAASASSAARQKLACETRPRPRPRHCGCQARSGRVTADMSRGGRSAQSVRVRARGACGPVNRAEMYSCRRHRPGACLPGCVKCAALAAAGGVEFTVKFTAQRHYYSVMYVLLLCTRATPRRCENGPRNVSPLTAPAAMITKFNGLVHSWQCVAARNGRPVTTRATCCVPLQSGA